MICPLISGVISGSYTSENPEFKTAVTEFVDCQKENCEMWLKPDSIHNGECSIKKIALGLRVHKSGPR